MIATGWNIVGGKEKAGTRSIAVATVAGFATKVGRRELQCLSLVQGFGSLLVAAVGFALAARCLSELLGLG